MVTVSYCSVLERKQLAINLREMNVFGIHGEGTSIPWSMLRWYIGCSFIDISLHVICSHLLLLTNRFILNLNHHCCVGTVI